MAQLMMHRENLETELSINITAWEGNIKKIYVFKSEQMLLKILCWIHF